MKKLSSLLLTLLVSLSLVGMNPAPASAEPAQINYVMTMWGGTFSDQMNTILFKIYKQDGSDLDPGTVVTVTFSSCGRVLVDRELTAVNEGEADILGGTFHESFPVFISTDGGLPEDMETNGLYHRVGESSNITFTFSDPEYDSVSWNMDTSNSYMTCAKINKIVNEEDDNEDGGSRPKALVKKWSVKSGKAKYAKFGKKVSVTRTTLSKAGVNIGAKVTYKWKVGNKTVKSGRTVFVKKAWKGKKLKMVVTVTSPGKKLVKRIGYGRVRK